jgi:hypothetical protein
MTAELGHCDLCGQELIRTEDDCWHPHTVQKACPPEVYNNGIPTAEFGDGFGRPGRQHWQADS